MPFLDQRDEVTPLYSCGPETPAPDVVGEITRLWRRGLYAWVAVSLSSGEMEVAIASNDVKSVHFSIMPYRVKVHQWGVALDRPDVGHWRQHRCDWPLDAKHIPPALRTAVVNWLKYGTPEPEGDW